jgi:hypothetical protein
MTYLRKNHLAIAGLLFVIAALLYFSGLALAAQSVFFLGAAVEIAAWVSLSRHLTKPSAPKAEGATSASKNDAF